METMELARTESQLSPIQRVRQAGALLMSTVALSAGGMLVAESASAEPVENFHETTLAQPNTTGQQRVFDCETAAINSFTGGHEAVVHNSSGGINFRKVRQVVSGREINNISPDGNPESCVGVVTRTVRAGELVKLNDGQTGMNTPMDSNNKPEAIYKGLAKFTASKIQDRLFAPNHNCGPQGVHAIKQYIEFDTSPANDPSQVYGKIYQGVWQKFTCQK
jgi:hypothetical protein